MSVQRYGLIALGLAAVALPAAVVASSQSAAPVGLKPVSAFATIADPAARSAAIFTEMGKVLTHPRCINCHPRTDSPLQGDDMRFHMPPVERGPGGMGIAGMECSTCHGPRNVTFAPMAWFFRNLKLEMLFFASVSRGRCPVISASSALASSSACFTSDCEPTEVLITTFSTLGIWCTFL